MVDRLLSKWECGIRTPTSFHLYYWADALKSKMTIVANDNLPPSSTYKGQKAVNDNILFKVSNFGDGK